MTEITVPQVSNILKSNVKQPNYYLVLLKENFHSKMNCFLSLDAPRNENNLVYVKGYLIELSLNDKSLDDFNVDSYLKNKNNVDSLMIPIYNIIYIKNLAYKAK